MNSKQKFLSPIFLIALTTGCGNNQQADVAELEVQARSITQQFVGTLLPTLQQALAEGGPESAIEVCSIRAPAIAAELAASTGWGVKRVSLRPRNTGSAIPDGWEQGVLEEFDQRQVAGEPGPSINTSAVVNGEYRFMQAQPAMPLCLTCHGSNIAPDVQAALQRHYPDDMATGYSSGQIRGAISLRLENAD